MTKGAQTILELSGKSVEGEREFILERDNLHMLTPQSNELFIDIDDEESYEIFSKTWKIIRSDWDLSQLFLSKKESPSKSGLPCRHIIVRMGISLTVLEKIGLQGVLGSDRTRDTLSMVRYFKGVNDPICFFEKNSPRIGEEDLALKTTWRWKYFVIALFITTLSLYHMNFSLPYEALDIILGVLLVGMLFCGAMIGFLENIGRRER